MGINLFTSIRTLVVRGMRPPTVRGKTVITTLIAGVVAVGLVIGMPGAAFAEEGDGAASVQPSAADPANTPPPSDQAPSDQSTAQPAPEPAPLAAPAASSTPSPSPSPSPSGSATLALRKIVVNDDGGTAVPSDWMLQVSSDGTAWTTVPQGAFASLPLGTYHLREIGGPGGYLLTNLTCDSYTWDAAAMTITLRDGDANTCTFTNDDTPWTDVGIVKTSSEIPDRGVDYAQSFSWFLTVTNHGTRDASDAVVTDAIPPGVTVQRVAVPAGWDDESRGSAIRVSIPELATGASGVIEVVVTVDPEPTAAAPFLPPGSAEPTLAMPSDTFVNTACVTTPGDDDSTDDCDTNTVPRKILAAAVWVSCINDAPFLMYKVAVSPSLRGLPITLTWTPTHTAVPASKVVLLTAATGRIDWPGVKWDASGVSYDWPGWRPLRDADFGSDGLPLAGLIVYGSSVRDLGQPDEGWRQPTTVTISVNPHIVFTAIYPPATPQCAVHRPPVVLAETGATDGFTMLLPPAIVAVLAGLMLLRRGLRRPVN